MSTPDNITNKNKFLKTLKNFIQDPEKNQSYLDKTLQDFIDCQRKERKIKSISHNKPMETLKKSGHKQDRKHEATEEDHQIPRLPHLNSLGKVKSPYSMLYFTDKSLDYRPEQTFTSFDKMIQKVMETSSYPLNTSNSIDERFLYTERSEGSQQLEILDKQLKHNLKQQRFFEERMDSLQQMTMNEVESTIKQKTRYLRKFLPLRINKKYLNEQSEAVNKTNPISSQKTQRKDEAASSSKKIYEDFSSRGFKLYWQGLESRAYRPDSREGATLTFLKKKRKLYLYGGLSHELMSTVCEFDLGKKIKFILINLLSIEELFSIK
jgi:hypothetical protein